MTSISDCFLMSYVITNFLMRKKGSMIAFRMIDFKVLRKGLFPFMGLAISSPDFSFFTSIFFYFHLVCIKNSDKFFNFSLLRQNSGIKLINP